LGSPIEINADFIWRKEHEAAHAGVAVVQALAVRVAAGGGAERKQARPIAAVASYWQLRRLNDAQAVAQRVQSFDAGGHGT